MGPVWKRVWAGISSILALGLLTSTLGSSAAVAAPGDPVFTTIGTPAISGPAKVGAELIVDPGSWDPEPTFAYQWLRDGGVIDAATGPGYVLTAADRDHLVSVRVTASAEGREDATVVSPATAKVAAGTLSYKVPTISGTLAIGATIRAVTAGWTAGTTFSYQWYADGRAISRATGEQFKLTSYQHAKRISVKVTGRLSGYTSVTRTSSLTPRVLRAGAVRAVGTPAVGITLTASRGTWTSRVSFSYQWLRDGVAIPGATRSSYRLAGADAGRQVAVKVTGKRSGYATVAKTSPPTARVTSAATPRISGSAFVGNLLTANPGIWSEGTTLTYQWLRSGYVIRGAVGDTYKVAAADEGKQLSLRVTGKQAGWATVVKTSARTPRAMKAGTPTISGTPNPGSALTAKAGSWTKYTSLSYQWRRNGAVISGATRSTYRLTNTDAGKQVSVTVTGRRSGYTTVSKTTAPVTVSITANGWYQVGVTIQPGTYAAPGGTACYWERYDGDPNYYEPVALMAPHDGPVRLTITAEDAWVYLQSCGAWRPLPTAGPQATTFGEGDLAVGIDIAPGLYTAPGGEYCFWRRADSARGELWDSTEDWWADAEEGVNGVISLSYNYNGQRIVEIAASDKFFSSTDCGTWRPLEASDPRASFSDGDYAIGIQLEPGVWETTTATPPDPDTGAARCLLWAYWGFGGSDDEWVGTVRGDTESFTIPVFPEHAMITSMGCGTFTRIGDLPPDATPTPRPTSSAISPLDWQAGRARDGADLASAAKAGSRSEGARTPRQR